MAYVPKEGSGSLFKNDRKVSENHPDYTGTILVNGKEHFLSAWVKEGKSGKFFSVSIGKEKLPKEAQVAPKKELDDDSLPF